MPVSASGTSNSKLKPLKALRNYVTSPFTSKNEIKFYNRDEPYYEFTNFYPTRILIDGKDWPTSEHYFQAQKFVGTPYVDAIRILPTPRDAFQLSRDPTVSRWRRSDWDRVKDDIMLKALRCKFEQNSQLRNKLLGTGDKTLIEHTHNDSYWGDGGGGGKGLNKLGQLLMIVRSELKSMYGSGSSPGESRKRSSSRLKKSNSFSISGHESDHKVQQPRSPQDDSSLYPNKPIVTFAPRLSRSSSLSNLSSSSSTSQPNSVLNSGTSPRTSVQSHHKGRPLPKDPVNKTNTVFLSKFIPSKPTTDFKGTYYSSRHFGHSAGVSTRQPVKALPPHTPPPKQYGTHSPTYASRTSSRSSTKSSNDSSAMYGILQYRT